MREKLAPFAADGVIEDTVEARAEVFERTQQSNASARFKPAPP
ncbi:MAG TPA: hypothetical protein VFE60_16605 [Roseiarcus sp.]|nr:hypothetical protein [Roseiarcus sp.]